MTAESIADQLTIVPPAAPQTDVVELVERVAELERSQQQEDVEGFLALFHHSAAWVTGGGVRLVGNAEIAAFTRQVLPGAFQRGSVTYAVRVVSFISPDIAITGVDQTYLDDDGRPVAENAYGRPTYVWRRGTKGVWLIVAGQNTGVVTD